MRTEFEAKDNIASARLYLAFQGIGNFYINGQEVAPDEWFKQGSMEYRDEIGYNVYDVTDYVTSGSNAMALLWARAGGPDTQKPMMIKFIITMEIKRLCLKPCNYLRRWYYRCDYL